MSITELPATLADIEICPDFEHFPLGILQFNTERYRSGHNGADSKSVCLNGHAGSNPALSAKRPQFSRIAVLIFMNKDRWSYEK